MTLPDTGPERPGSLASETREMAADDMKDVVLGTGPRGHVFLILAGVIIAAVVVWLLVR